MLVVSTAFHPAPDARELCLASVRNQRNVEVVHLYIDAAMQATPQSVTENLRQMISGRHPNEIVAWLDGDDSLAHPGVLNIVASVYAENPDVWLTFGSYRCFDGRPGCCAPYETDQYRREPWRASHLRTFRAGLFQRIKPEDLVTEVRGKSQGAPDHAVMFPMLEMAGPSRVRFIPEVLVLYNFRDSFEHGATTEDLAHERAAARRIRERTPYARLEAL